MSHPHSDGSGTPTPEELHAMTPAERARRLPRTPEYLAQQRRNNRLAAVVVTAMAACTALGLGMMFSQRTSGAAITLPERERPTLGAPDARNTVVIYADFQCPACQNFHATVLPQLKASASERNLKVVFANRILFGEGSVRAATAAECAYRTGGLNAYESVSELLYAAGRRAGERDASWTTQPKLQAIAQAAGLKMPAFTACMSAGAARHAVMDESQSIALQGGNSTPGVVVNGRRVPQSTWDRIQRQLDRVDVTELQSRS